MFSLLVFMVFNETLPGLDELNVSSYWRGGIPLGLGKVRWENHPTKWILARMVPLKSLPMFTGWWFGTFFIVHFLFFRGVETTNQFTYGMCPCHENMYETAWSKCKSI